MKKPVLGTRFAFLRNRFQPSAISQALRGIFSGGGSKTLTRPPRARHGQAFTLEALEPRLLLSAATIDYATALTTNLTLAAIDETHVQLSDGSGYTSAATDLAASGGALDLSRSIGAAIFGDTVHLDLSSLKNLTTGLSVNFTGGLQSLVSQDTVQLDGSG